jgi:hypothetical protein
MGTKPCPACKGTGKSPNPLHAYCLGCGGTGEIDTPGRRQASRGWSAPSAGMAAHGTGPGSPRGARRAAPPDAWQLLPEGPLHVLAC